MTDTYLTSLINRDDTFTGLKVRALRAPFGGHPHALTLARLGRRCLHVRQDDMTIKVAFVDVLSGRVEARTTVHVALLRVRLALLPLEDLIFSNAGVEGHNGKRSNIRESVSYTHLTLPTTPYV